MKTDTNQNSTLTSIDNSILLAEAKISQWGFLDIEQLEDAKKYHRDLKERLKALSPSKTPSAAPRLLIVDKILSYIDILIADSVSDAEGGGHEDA